ncbi:hypothetical protein DYO76_25680, partial [Salmonella enterica subsp. enterica serovar Kentucky]|nr:hypothetical protein [Salmonella enterica subsp. enterica serovar Kentucky]ECB7649073.1 hypothetical protein [Salmonella enterica subsp. enterica serovar Kentucky]ECU3332016.1 hypothetical protein [Salmonella enterica subsp. enterica serovar Kentucky]EJR1654101.1 Tar ligand binding domain-containing protein [Salmonella enterica subsp. enterica serovar Kentucky]
MVTYLLKKLNLVVIIMSIMLFFLVFQVSTNSILLNSIKNSNFIFSKLMALSDTKSEIYSLNNELSKTRTKLLAIGATVLSNDRNSEEENNVKKQLAHIAKTLQLTSKKWEILKQKHKSDNSFKELDKKFKQLHNSLIELCNFLSAGDIKSA